MLIGSTSSRKIANSKVLHFQVVFIQLSRMESLRSAVRGRYTKGHSHILKPASVPMTFKDRRFEIFGRATVTEHLKLRAKTKGFTAIVARPKMGNTWLLTEVNRILSERPDEYESGMNRR